MIRWLAVLALVWMTPALADAGQQTARSDAGQQTALADAGQQKWQAGDWAGAVAEWNRAAARGDPEALFGLGQAYRLGRGVAENRAMAIDYYRRAADRGHLPALASLGLTLFQNGQKTEALKILREAADRGEPRAAYVLGVATFGGDGTQRNQILGYAYVLRARDMGLRLAAAQADRMAALMSPAARARGTETAAALAGGTATATATPAAPAAPPAAAETATVASDGWKVQLGAYTTQQAARRAWATLLSQGTALQDEPVLYAPSRGVVRLQVGPYAERRQAVDLCARVAAGGRPCFVTR